MSEKVAVALAGNAGLAVGLAGLAALVLERAGLVRFPQFGGTVISPTFTDSAAPSFSPAFSPTFAPVNEAPAPIVFMAPADVQAPLPSPSGPAPTPASPSAPPDSTPGQPAPARAGTLTRAEFAALVGGEAEAKRLRDRYKRNRSPIWDNLGNGRERWAYAVHHGLVPADYVPPAPPGPSPAPPPADPGLPAPSPGDPFAFPDAAAPAPVTVPFFPTPAGLGTAILGGLRAPTVLDAGAAGGVAGQLGGVGLRRAEDVAEKVLLGTGTFLLDGVPSFVSGYFGGPRVRTTDAIFRSGQVTGDFYRRLVSWPTVRQEVR